jgi:hypothetical protein
MADNDTTGTPAGQPSEPSSSSINLHLPEFWIDTPSSWFIYVESKFRIKNITSEHMKFDLVVSSLPRDSIRQVIDVLERPHADTPYTVLKSRLLSSHELTVFQKIEQLHKVEPLGGRRPSELLSHMMELCPRGEENNKFFWFLFLQRLPRELRVLLTEDDFGEPRELAAKADRHWAMLSHQHGMVASLEACDDGETVAAVQQRPRGKARFQKKKSRNYGGGHTSQQQQTDGGAGSNSTLMNPAPGTVARLAAGLCHFHWCYGDKARQCEQPCKWEN